MATILEYLCENDRRALGDFINCTDHCDDCRANELCDAYMAFGDNGVKITEAHFLMLPWEVPWETPDAGEASMMSVEAHVNNQLEKELFAMKMKVDELDHNYGGLRWRIERLECSS